MGRECETAWALNHPSYELSGQLHLGKEGNFRKGRRPENLNAARLVWHPAKPLLENRVEFVHCIVIIMHCLHKTIFAKPFCFLNAPYFIQTPKPGSPELFCLLLSGCKRPD